MRRALVMLSCLVAVAAPARAAEFVPGMEAYGAWDSNLFHTQENQESAFSVLAGPVLQLRESQGSLQYDLKYTMHYEAFPSISGINDFQHFVDASGSYRFENGRTMLSVRNSFSSASSAVQIFNTGLPPTAGLLQVGQGREEAAREQFIFNDAGVTLQHSLTPRWQLQFSFDYTLSEFPQNKQLSIDQFNSTSMVGAAQITRQISPRLSAGFGTSVTRQDFEQQGVSGRGATFYQGFGIVNYQIAPTLALQASVGPAINDPDQLNTPSQRANVIAYPTINGQFVALDSCPFQGAFRVFDPSNPNRCRPISGFGPATNFVESVPFVGANQVSSPQPTLTYYGRFSLTKRWETLTAVLSYDRSASTASGLGTSTNIDSLGSSLTWLPTSMWSITLSSTYSRQTAASKTQQPLFALGPGGIVPIGGGLGIESARNIGITSRLVNNGLEFNTYRVDLNVSRHITKQLTLIGIAGFWRQENTGSLNVQSSHVEDFRFQFGFTYTLDPIPLWTKDL